MTDEEIEWKGPAKVLAGILWIFACLIFVPPLLTTLGQGAGTAVFVAMMLLVLPIAVLVAKRGAARRVRQRGARTQIMFSIAGLFGAGTVWMLTEGRTTGASAAASVGIVYLASGIATLRSGRDAVDR